MCLITRVYSIVRHILRVFKCRRLLSHEMSSIQLTPILVASSTVHSANLELEPGSKMRNEIGDSGACALTDALRVKKSLKTLQ